MLTSISKQPLKGSGAQNSDGGGLADDGSSDTTPTTDQQAGTDSIQTQVDKNTASSPVESGSDAAKISDAKLDPQSGAVATTSDNNMGTGKAQQSAGDTDTSKANAKKTPSTSEVVSNESHQASTVQVQISAFIVPPVETSAVDKPTATAGSAKQTNTNQNADQDLALSGVAQTETTSAATGDGTELHAAHSGKGSAGPIVLAALQKPSSDSGLFAPQLNSKAASDAAPAASGDKAAGTTTVADSTNTAQAGLASSISTWMDNLPANAGMSRVDQRSNHPELASAANGSNSSTGSVTGTSKAGKADGSGTNGAGTQASSTNGVTPLHSQIAAVQRSIVEASGAETRVMPTMVGAPHAESRNFSGASNPSTVAQTGTLAANGTDGEEQELPNGMASVGMSGISAARLVQTMGSSEMRMGMHSSEFGNISIRTSVSQQQIQAQISVDHSGLGSALSTHINAVQSKLGSEYGLNANIQLNQNGASPSGERDGSQQQQSRAADRPSALQEAPTTQQTDLAMPAVAVSAGSNYRLDIRA
jgi:hypothetical protein